MNLLPLFSPRKRARKVSKSTGLRNQKKILRRPSIRPSLEYLEDRLVPSTSASTPPAVAEAPSQVVSTMNQMLVRIENDLSQMEQTIIQQIAQEMAVVQQQWAHLLGIDTNSANPSTNTSVPQPVNSSGSDNGSSNRNLGLITNQNGGRKVMTSGSNSTTKPRAAANPSVQTLVPSGETDGSGSGAKTTAHNAASPQLKTATPQAGTTASPALPSASELSGGSSSIPNFGTGYGTVSGQVWLDSNGDGLLDNGETGLSGITVYLCNSQGQEGPSTTTDANGNYSFQLNNGLYNLPQQFEIQVVIPNGDMATGENAPGSGINSNINAEGYSSVFTLSPNGTQQVNAGLTSPSGSSTVSGVGWFDNDGGGIMDPDWQSGMIDTTVNLDSGSGTTLLTTTTDDNGNYQFNVTSALLYKYSSFMIQVIIPNGDQATVENASGSGINSNINASGYSNALALIPPGSRINLNFGLDSIVGNSDFLYWNPQNGSTIGSYASNWYDETQGKQGICAPIGTNNVYFDGTANSKTSSNSPIEWVLPKDLPGILYPCADMTLQNGYTGQMTMDAGKVTVSVVGNFVESSPCWLKVSFGDNSSFKIGNGAFITNMVLAGSQLGTFDLNGGGSIVNENTGQTVKIGVQVYIASGATLWDYNNSQIVLTNTNLTISVLGGMDFLTNGKSSTMIEAAGLTGDYINVTDGGILKYWGSGGVKDTIMVPVLVGDGDFLLQSEKGSPAGGTLIVQGTVPNQPNNASVYVTGDGTSTVQLSQQATLECDQDYYQDSGTLETTDPSVCTLQDGAVGSAGTANIVGGSLIVAQDVLGAYGELDVSCNILNFAGTYAPGIAGDESFANDKLKVLGTMNIQDAASLSINADEPLEAGNQWTIITADNKLQPFFNTNEVALGLKEQVTKNYILTS